MLTRDQVIRRLPLGLLIALLCGAVFSAFKKGGQDLSVFYNAWSLVGEGKYFDLYREGPDRFLYAPGFAFLGFAISYLPFSIILVVWTAAKLIATVGVFYKAAEWIEKHFKLSRVQAAWVSVLGLLCVMRPLFIDFRYGQVNFFILVATFWWLCADWSKRSKTKQIALSVAFGLGAIAKVMTLPLLIWLFYRKGRRLAIHMPSFLGVVIAFGLLFFSPLFVLGYSEGLRLHGEWLSALVQKGFPLESHNQSFAAFFIRAFSEGPAYAHILGYERLPWGLGWISNDVIPLWIDLLKRFFFFLGILSQIFFWWNSQKFLNVDSAENKSMHLIMRVGSLFMVLLPLYLVWKPYFLYTLPLFWVLWASLLSDLTPGLSPDLSPYLGQKHKASKKEIFNDKKNRMIWGQVFLGIFGVLLINLTTFGIFNARWTAIFEVGCAMLWGGLLVFILILFKIGQKNRVYLGKS